MKHYNEFNFYFITNSLISRNGILSDVKKAIDAGCKIIQYREKNKSTELMVKEALELKRICKGKAIFLINDHVDVALSVDADGVHLGQRDISVEDARQHLGNDRIIGLTVHNVLEAIEAEKKGVDYIGLAPIYMTDTKEDSGIPCGPGMILEIRKNTKLPIVAVGGINKYNLKDVISNGADGVVAVSAILEKNNVFSEVKDFIRIIKRYKANDAT